MKEKSKTTCPVSETIEIIGKKWLLLIIYNLLSGEKRFKDLENSLGQICPKMLSERLKELEESKLVKRKIYPKRPLKITYKLTQKGKSLYKIIEAMDRWGRKFATPH